MIYVEFSFIAKLYYYWYVKPGQPADKLIDISSCYALTLIDTA